jgi:hypothetical protein
MQVLEVKTYLTVEYRLMLTDDYKFVATVFPVDMVLNKPLYIVGENAYQVMNALEAEIDKMISSKITSWEQLILSLNTYAIVNTNIGNEICIDIVRILFTSFVVFNTNVDQKTMLGIKKLIEKDD